ncbi:MAG TPA: hypothetical protein VEG60_19070, partial [Candidatus Binatia bacterium]|nr:hypothetical protein [Candidatus Binatia bacterium]
RDRFEEIVRKYPGTPVAARSLFFLGESYRKEKNSVKAALAYEALLQHYPESKFAPEAKTTLTQLEKEKQDPLAMLLMRDHRPVAVAGGTVQDTATSEKLKNIDNLTAKTEIVYEEPGAEKSIFSQVADKINPFSSSDDEKKARESPTELAAAKNTDEQKDSPGAVASMWSTINPFGGEKSTPANKTTPANKKEAPVNTQLVNQIDESFKQKGIDGATQTASLKPPAAAMPKVESPPPQTMDTTKLLGDIDAALKESGQNAAEAPAPPEAHPAFDKPATTEGVAEKTKPKPQPQQDGVSGNVLSSIDEKLKSQGFEPSKIEPPPTPPTPDQLKARQEATKKVELEPKVAVEKGPLFLGPAEIPAQRKAPSADASASAEKKTESSEKPQAPAGGDFPRTLVKGPTQPQPAAKTAQKPLSLEQEDGSKGAFEQLKSDIESARKALNPFSW